MRSPTTHRRHAGVPAPWRECVESLEPRRLLAVATPSLPADLRDTLDARVWTTSQRLTKHLRNSLLRSGAARVDSSNRLQLDLHTGASPAAIAKRLRAMGARVTEILVGEQIIEAYIPAGSVETVARMSGVRSLSLPDYAITNVTSDGDSIHEADRVRSQFAALGLNGTGIKVGVISNGVAHRANVGSELPTITIDPARPGSGDEGTAMLEIVHDLAPGAQLYSTAPASSTEMVSSINYLVGQGCKVIVDDLTFLGEPYFTDGPVANAAASAVSNGVVYVTSAGNFGNQQHYQAQYVQSATSFGGGRLHLFATGDDSDNVSISNGSRFRAFLQWSDAWGASSNDYDLYLINSSNLATLAQSSGIQDGNDNPFELVDWTNNTGSTMQAEVWVVKKSAAAVREIELFTLGNSSLQFSTSGDALTGQQAVASVLTVAAAPAWNPGSIESYSSRGGSTVYTNFTTQTKTIRQTLDGTAVDGVETAVGQLGFFNNPFYGTSAAAPHAAAIAALIRQQNPSLTPAQVLQVMADTAIDLSVSGYDVNSGAGLYDALDAAYKLYTPGQPDLDGGSDLGASNTDNLTADNIPTFTGTVPAASYVRLFVDGAQVNAVQLGAGVTSYAVAPIFALSDATHLITIRVSADSSVLLTNNSNVSAALSITIETTAPVMLSSAFNFAGPGAPSLSYTFSESVAGSVQASDLRLEDIYDGSSINPANVLATNSPGTSVVFTFPGYRYGVLPDGIYIASIDPDNITDLAGNPMPMGSIVPFFVLGGDANHDGIVDAADLGILSNNWQGSGKVFAQSDFNYDGKVDINDLYILAHNWKKDLFA
jgi:subtilisin family serine protease